MNRITYIDTNMMQLEEALRLAELCRWLADNQPISEVMKQLAKEDLGQMECFSLCAFEIEFTKVCGDLPQYSLAVMQEYCALSRHRSHAHTVLSRASTA